MILNFGNKAASDLYHKGECRLLPRQYWRRAADLLDVMEAIESLKDLESKSFPPSIRLHKLSGNRRSEFALDIHKISGWRITFQYQNNAFCDVKIENYH